MTARPVVQTTNDMVAAFSIPCTRLLANDTLHTELISDAGTLLTRRDGVDTLSVSNEGRTRLRVENQTATGVASRFQAFVDFGDLAFEITRLGEPEGSVIPPGGSETWAILVQPNWQHFVVPQGLRSVSALTVQVTATLVISIGPTSAITQPLVVARPETMYLPVAARDLSSGW